MGPSDDFSTKFAPTGTVEIEHNGLVYRATYRTTADIVAVSYGDQEWQMQMRRQTDTPLGVARIVLRAIVAKLHDRT